MATSGNEVPVTSATGRKWLTAEGAVEYLAERYAIEYSVTSIYRKARGGGLPCKRPPGSNALRFDPDELDAWAAGSWEPKAAPIGAEA